MKNRVLLGVFAFGFFMCSYGGVFESKDVQSVYVEESVVGVGDSVEAVWVNQPKWVVKESEWFVSDESMATVGVSADGKVATVEFLKEGNVIIGLKYDGEIIDSVEMSIVDDSVSAQRIDASMNKESEVAISGFIKVSDPEKLKWVSSDENIISVDGNLRSQIFVPKSTGSVKLSAYYGDRLIGDTDIMVASEEPLPEESLRYVDGVNVLDSSYIYNNLNPAVTYNIGEIDASTYLGVVDGNLTFAEKKSRFGSGSDELNLSSYAYALREGEETVKLRILDKEYTLKVQVKGNDKTILYKRWLKAWSKTIDMEAGVMDKVEAARDHMNTLSYDNKTYNKCDVALTNKGNTLGSTDLFIDMCRKLGVKCVPMVVNQDLVGKDPLNLVTGSNVLNYHMAVVTDGDSKYIVDVTPHEGESAKCYRYGEAEKGSWVNMW